VGLGGSEHLLSAAFDFADFSTTSGGSLVKPALIHNGTVWTSGFLFPADPDRIGFSMGLPGLQQMDSDVLYSASNNAS